MIGIDDDTCPFEDMHSDNVGVDKATDPRFPLLKLLVEASVIERGRGLRGKKPQNGDPRGRKHPLR
jgi:hypothetical protein